VTLGRSTTCLSLLHDAALLVDIDDELLESVRVWLPLHAEATSATQSPANGATIEVRAATVDDDAVHARPDDEAAPGAPTLVLFAGVKAHEAAGDVIVLRSRAAVAGRISLAERRARISCASVARDDVPSTQRATDLYSMLTLSAAFLVGRLGAALVHAGAVVDPDGRAWLLVGDTHAGKTTTCVSLVHAGWSFLADDQVVLRRDGDAIVAEGWPRHAHLDEGWDESRVTGTRGALDLRARWGDRWRSRAPLGGLLFPRVVADAPTSVSPLHAAAAFAGLVRQSPWLMADRGAAPAVIELLRDACSRPSFALSLGRDSYARGDVLAARLGPALSVANGAER